MSRLRATLSTSELDARIQSHVAVAERSIQQALQILREANRKGGHPRSRRVERDLGRLLGGLSNFGRVQPSYDTNDADFSPDGTRERPPVQAAEPEVEPEVEVPDEPAEPAPSVGGE